MPVTINGPLEPARFVERPNRFIVVAETSKGRVKAHCPNPGRLGEFRHPGTPYLLRRRPDASEDQATEYSVVAAKDGRFHVDAPLALGQAPDEASFEDGAWVLLDTVLANRLVAEALSTGAMEHVFGIVDAYTREPASGSGRFDFSWETDEGRLLLEVKSVTLIGNDGATALFPDAPTERGTRHVRELTKRARDGDPAAVAFVALREDAERVAPNAFTDPGFAEALARAIEAGVDVFGLRAGFDLELGQVDLETRIPVVTDPGDAATGVSSKGEPVDANTA